MKIYLCSLLLIALNLKVNAQADRFRYRVWIPKWLDIQEKLSSKARKTIVLPAGTTIRSVQKYKLNQIDYEAVQAETLNESKEILVESSITKTTTKKLPGWANLSNKKDTIFINYWLKGKANEDAEYFMTLRNRRYQGFYFRAAEIGAITIPFRFHSGYSKESIEVPSTLGTNFNIGLYGGYTIGRVIYKYRKNEDPTFNEQFNLTFGPFASLSSVSLDKTNTLTANEPITNDTKINVATFSTGVGLIAAAHNIRFGIFYGFDFGIGNTAQKWDYNRRPWIGFGFGFNVISFGKS